MGTPVPSATSHLGFLLGCREAPSVPYPTFESLWLAKTCQSSSPIQPGHSAELESRNTHPQNLASALEDALADGETCI